MGSHLLSTTFTDTVKRAVRYDEWIDAEGNAEDIIRAGQHGDIINGAVMTPTRPDITDLSWSLHHPEDFNAITDLSYFNDGEFGFVPAQVRGDLTAQQTFGPDAEGVLVYNGKAVGMVSELAGLKKGASTSFRSTLNWNYLHGPPTGAGLEMWIVQGTGAARVIQRVATPKTGEGYEIGLAVCGEARKSKGFIDGAGSTKCDSFGLVWSTGRNNGLSEPGGEQLH